MHSHSLNIEMLKPIFDFELFKVCQQDREDVKQTALLRILTSIKNYDKEQLPEDKLFSFSQVVIKRTVVDYFRKINRKIEMKSKLVNFSDRCTFINGSTEVEDGVMADCFKSPVHDYGFDLAEVRIDYCRNKHKFSPQERKVIEIMLFTEEGLGMKMSEVSRKLGIHKSHATRALQTLRKVCADR